MVYCFCFHSMCYFQYKPKKKVCVVDECSHGEQCSHPLKIIAITFLLFNFVHWISSFIFLWALYHISFYFIFFFIWNFILKCFNWGISAVIQSVYNGINTNRNAKIIECLVEPRFIVRSQSLFCKLIDEHRLLKWNSSWWKIFYISG